MRIEYDPKLDFDDVLIRPKRSVLLSRKNVQLVREFSFKHSDQKYKAVPIIAANMDHTGTFEMADALKQFGVSVALHKHYDPENVAANYISEQYVNKVNVPMFYSMGISKTDFNKLLHFYQERGRYPRYINIDIANGYSEQFASFVREVRTLVGVGSVIMAGNVVTGEMTEQLILSGADIVKVGIGPGSVCTTRKLTGVGYPQLSAIIECADAAHGMGGLICGDGGCKVPGDVAKAFAAGADFVMLGGMFAGHDECSGTIEGIDYRFALTPAAGWDAVVSRTLDSFECSATDGNKYQISASDLHTMKNLSDNELHPGKFLHEYPFAYRTVTDARGPRMKFYGMSSDTAMELYAGGVADYRASEGKTVEVPYKGAVADTIREILGGIRSTCTYVGAERLKDLSKRTSFILVGRQLNNKFGD